MQKQDYQINNERLTKFRQDMHQFPETGFQEYRTQEKTINYLHQNLNIPLNQIKKAAKTGIYVDFQGKLPPKGEKLTIALRTDIDALPMTEENENLSYQSQTKADHACGHDGHTATMLGFIEILVQALDIIPQNKTIRVLFQPSEEGPASGALLMVQEGLLKNVDEIYGYHNWPMHPVGYLLVKEGPLMASQTVIQIKIIGKGGHGSQPQSANDPVQIGVSFYQKFQNLVENTLKGRKFVCTLPVFNAGSQDSVIAETAQIEGTLRSLEKDFPIEFEKLLHQILQETIEMQQHKGAKYELNYIRTFEQVTNTKKEAENVLKVANKIMDPQKVGDFGILPVMASEDFSHYLNEIPGCFFFLGSGRKMNDIMLHNAHYNFNDELIVPGANFFWELIKYRFEI